MRAIAFAYAALVAIGIVLSSGCGATVAKVADAALGVLDAVCETRQSAELEMARQFYQRGDYLAAAKQLRAYLEQHGADREVSALLSLVESQIPESALAPLFEQ